MPGHPKDFFGFGASAWWQEPLLSEASPSTLSARLAQRQVVAFGVTRPSEVLSSMP